MIKKLNIAILLGTLCLIIIGGFFSISEIGTVTNQNSKMIAEDIEDAVGKVIKEQGKSYFNGECITEGHIILGQEEKGGTVKVYTIASVGWFGFENGIFTKISGSGSIPTVITFSKNAAAEYSLLEYREPMDGAGYPDSMKKMFPRNLHNKVFNAQDYYPDLAKQQEAQAAQYLKTIGSAAKVRADHVEKELVNIDVEASNKLFAEFTKFNSLLNNCPYWIGTKEQVEDGIRYVYETSQNKSTDGCDVITFKKTKEDGTVVEEISYKIVGNEPQQVQ
jgi:bla regulator protein BlaR1